MVAFDFRGLNRRMKKLSHVFDGFLERIINDHVKDKQNHDFVDTIMEIMESGKAGFEFDRRSVMAVLLDMLVGGMDTSSSAIEWALSELIMHPKVIMKKLQNELEQVVGMDQNVDESHLDKLTYLNMVVKETFRLHPTGALLTHQSTKDCTINKYHVPKGSWIFVNVWSIDKDHNMWDDSENFNPERFVESDVDLLGQHFQLLSFGAGRRGCPGLQLGLVMVRLLVAQLVHCFDWELPAKMLPSDLDMTERFSLVMGRNVPLTTIQFIGAPHK